MGSIWGKIRPNILVGMCLVALLGIAISYIGLRLDNEGIISSAGVGSIVAISNLAGKILEKE
mgnify:CR=1 FL=1